MPQGLTPAPASANTFDPHSVLLSAYSGATWAPVPAALGHGFRNDAGAHSGSIWALIPA